MITSDAMKWHGFRISPAQLLIYLFLGSLVILPILLVVGMSVASIPVIDLEIPSGFEESEFDDDFLVLPIVEFTIAVSIVSKCRGINLGFQSAFLAPILPPPR